MNNILVVSLVICVASTLFILFSCENRDSKTMPTSTPSGAVAPSRVYVSNMLKEHLPSIAELAVQLGENKEMADGDRIELVESRMSFHYVWEILNGRDHYGPPIPPVIPRSLRNYMGERLADPSDEFAEVYRVWPGIIRHVTWHPNSAAILGLRAGLLEEEELSDAARSRSDELDSDRMKKMERHAWAQKLLLEITGKTFKSFESFEHWHERAEKTMHWNVEAGRLESIVD